MEEETRNIRLVTLTPDELSNLINAAGEAGAKAAIEAVEEKKLTLHEEIVDKRLHNTRLLLESYHMLKLNMDHSVYGCYQLGESAADILNAMMNAYNDDIIVESIKRSAARTGIIVKHIDTMLGLYEAYCTRTKKVVDNRRYDILYDFYIANQLLSVAELAKKHHISKQTVYDDLKFGEEKLTALIFGIDSLKLKK